MSLFGDFDADDAYNDEQAIGSELGGSSPRAPSSNSSQQQAFEQLGGRVVLSDDGAEVGDGSSNVTRPAATGGPDSNTKGAAFSVSKSNHRIPWGSASVCDSSHGRPYNEGRPYNQGVGKNDSQPVADCHVRQMPGYGERELNGQVLLGHGVRVFGPTFQHSFAGASGWLRYDDAMFNYKLAPVRSMCFNIPVECFSMDASKFNDWQTPINNSVRAASIAAILGMAATPLSKGFMSGNHEEAARATQQGEGNGGREGGAGHGEAGKEIKTPKRVHQYMFPDPNDLHQNMPMVVIGYEDVYDSQRKSVVAIRIWHFVFDKSHSTSELARKLMNESADESDHSGAAHCPNNLRKTSVVAAAKATRALIGASLESTQLELAAGLCYRHVLNESVFKNLLGHYAGHSDKSPGLPPVDPQSFPPGFLNKHLAPDAELGCTHPLAFEWVFNAKRVEALKAGLVHLDGTPMDVDPEQITVTSYFDVSSPALESPANENDPGGDTHRFRVPDWVGTDKRGGKGCFFFQTDPNRMNIFDMVLPHTITGAIKPGVNLMTLYKERFAADDDRVTVDSPLLLARFNNTMTGRDQWMLHQINSVAESIVNFDTVDTSAEQRMDAKTAKKAASRGLASYGQMDGDSHVVEPRQVLKEHAYTTSNVHSKLVSPWAAEMRSNFVEQEAKLRAVDDGEYEETSIHHPHFDELRAARAGFDTRYCAIMKELVLLHLSKMNRSFTSRIDKESIPAGYRAVWDGLHEELANMPDGTANVAFADNNQLTDSDRSVFAHMTNWLGTFFEDDCFVDGRDWRLMQELFYHCFEQFGEQTLLLIFCGPKGNGKTLRTERAMRAFVKNWLVMSGPSSAKAGMQGNSDSSNGCNCIYDEMIDELTDGDGSNRTEYWKQILLKRQYVYNKPVVVKGADGREMHKTFKLLTPHQETHCVCTNRGPAFTKGDEDPNEVKIALIDRAHVHFVRTLGSKTHDDQEFEDHLGNPVVRRKLRMFRIMTCLMGMLKLLIFRQPYLKPDTAFAQKLWDIWDDAISKKYGLPKPSPRKNIKRLENLITMCCQNAVGHVFFFKQTAHKFDAGQTTEEFPKGKPFELSMLWECVQLLQPTREMIHMAWTMGLEYNIGTSAMGLNTMTIVSEVVGVHPGDLLAKVPDDPAAFAQHDSTLLEAALEDVAERHRRSARDGKNSQLSGDAPQIPFTQPRSDTNILPEFERLLAGSKSYITVETIKHMRSQMRARRETRNRYAYLCSKSEVQNSLMADSVAMIDGVLGDSMGSMTLDPMPAQDMETDGGVAASVDGPRNEGSDCGSSSRGSDREAVGMQMWQDDEDPGGLSPADPALIGFHRARAMDYPGAENCAFIHAQTTDDMRMCPYCCTTLEESEADAARVAAGAEEATVAVQLSESVSFAFPTLLEAACFYKPQTIMQFATGRGAYIESGGTPVVATRASGSASIGYYEKTNGTTGASRKDLGWFQGKGEQWKKWGRAADYIRGHGYQAVMQFDMHTDGLRDCLFLCSTRDNARLIREEPRLPISMRPENCMKTLDNKRVTEETVCVQVATPYYVPNGDKKIPVSKEHEHAPRHPAAQIKNTKLQRRFDSLFHAGRMSALGIITSNKVSSKPPIRMHADGMMFSVSAVHAHVSLLLECVLDCALQPGLKNMQEKFCNDASGPPGLSRPQSTESKKGGKKSVAGEKRTIDDDVIHTLPYSYDIISMALSMAMSEMLYDDLGPQWVRNSVAKYGACYGLKIGFEQLPHLSMRFIGYEEVNRQTLSVKLQKTRRQGQEYVEAGDPDQEQSRITKAHVQRSLGKQVTNEEVASYISRRQGATSMSGVRGDIFASSTWFKHTVATLRARGLITGAQGEAAVNTFADMEQCINARVVEHASVCKDARYEAYNIFHASPGTYAAVETRREAEAAQPRPPKRRARAEINELPFDAMNMDFGPTIPVPVGYDVRFGAGPDRD